MGSQGGQYPTAQLDWHSGIREAVICIFGFVVFVSPHHNLEGTKEAVYITNYPNATQLLLHGDHRWWWEVYTVVLHVGAPLLAYLTARTNDLSRVFSDHLVDIVAPVLILSLMIGCVLNQIASVAGKDEATGVGLWAIVPLVLSCIY